MSRAAQDLTSEIARGTFEVREKDGDHEPRGVARCRGARSERVLELLRGSVVGRLAISIASHPDIFPINYVVDHGTIVFRTAEGTKLAGSVLGPGVAFEADGLDTWAKQAWSVVVKGRATEIVAMQELFDAADLPLFPWLASPKNRFVRILPDEVTGRRFHVVDTPEEAPAAKRSSHD